MVLQCPSWAAKGTDLGVGLLTLCPLTALTREACDAYKCLSSGSSHDNTFLVWMLVCDLVEENGKDWNPWEWKDFYRHRIQRQTNNRKIKTKQMSAFLLLERAGYIWVHLMQIHRIDSWFNERLSYLKFLNAFEPGASHFLSVLQPKVLYPIVLLTVWQCSCHTKVPMDWKGPFTGECLNNNQWWHLTDKHIDKPVSHQ